jgi:beta-galactosidase
MLSIFPEEGGLKLNSSRVDIPHNLVELPFNHFDEKSLALRGVYEKEFVSPEIPKGGSVFLDFEGVAISCEIWLNEQCLGVHKSPYTPFSIEVTRTLAPEGQNRLKVIVSAKEDPQIPPFGGVVDYLVPGGIYRAVWMRIQDSLRIETVHARPRLRSMAGTIGTAGDLDVDVDVYGSSPGQCFVKARIEMDGKTCAETRAEIPSLAQGKVQTLKLRFPPHLNIVPWDIDSPKLYTLEVSLVAGSSENKGESCVDRVCERIGFRSAVFTPEGFFLNGRRRFLRGLNRHQLWPYSGYAMGSGPQRKDAELCAKDLGLSLVRTSHYPQSKHFLDACDELGLLVFTEMPGWQHIGGEAWKNQALEDLKSLITRDWNHPSIVLWGVRINESQDDESFYAKTNALAASLDPERQRGGVRYIRKSQFLEDVYTFNDFSYEGRGAAIADPRKVVGLRRRVPYLISEHSGHMFPTKRYDQEERLAEHVRRHGRVLDAAMGDKNISGAIGWCAFDYATHKDFGSGDRLCYHGVSDAFRIPKYAASLYASQVNPKQRIVLEPASIFAKGERNAARLLPIDVYTNCDAVDLYRSGERVGCFYPDRTSFPHLEHPPVVLNDWIGRNIDAEGFSPGDTSLFLRLAGKAMALGPSGLGLGDKLAFGLFLARNRMSFAQVEKLVVKYGLAWGSQDDSIELVGILDGKEAIRRGFGADAHAVELSAVADDEILRYSPGDEWNATRIVVRLKDQYGNHCPFAFLPVHVKIVGPGRILGPGEFSLLGGVSAFWVASTGIPGPIQLMVTVPEFPPCRLTILAEEFDDRA